MNSYVLGHTQRERDRLDLQGQLYQRATRRALEDGGITTGMRVLDVGCGSGDVTRLVAELVGPDGFVHGIDRDAATIADATQRATSSGCNNSSYGVAGFGDDLNMPVFDAVVGRFILMHQPDPVQALTWATGLVKKNGPVVFVESHMVSLLHGLHSYPKSEVYDKLVRWKCRVVQAAGAETAMGLKLRRVFVDAGLAEPTMRTEAPLFGGKESGYYAYMEESVRSMLPQALANGIEGLDEERVAKIENELRDDVVNNDGILVAWPVVAAWSRAA